MIMETLTKENFKQKYFEKVISLYKDIANEEAPLSFRLALVNEINKGYEKNKEKIEQILDGERERL